jgi:hypothetical protein
MYPLIHTSSRRRNVFTFISSIMDLMYFYKKIIIKYKFSLYYNNIFLLEKICDFVAILFFLFPKIWLKFNILGSNYKIGRLLFVLLTTGN